MSPESFLADGTRVEPPLDGYQYPVVAAAGQGDWEGI
jgi:hypothetical protein